MRLSKLSNDYLGQGMFQILSKAKKLQRQGHRLIHFQLGDPDFNTPVNIIDSAVKSLIGNQTHYVQSSGLYDLKIAAQYVTKISRLFQPQMQQLLVTSGANMQIYLALARTCDPGDEVIIPNPYFPTYMACIKALGLIPKQVMLLQSQGFQMNPEMIKNMITQRTKCILINSPGNPTGVVLKPKIVQQIFHIAQKNDLLLISDQVYSRQIYNGSFFSPSMLDRCQRTVLIVNGFSKSFAMTGWRLGVATGPRQLISKMKILLQTIISCVPPFIQRAGVSALMQDQSQIVKMNKQFHDRMLILSGQLNGIDGLKCNIPDGALYCWVNIQETRLSSIQFADLLLSKGVVVCPGDIFGRSGYIRLCYCTSMQNIKQGIRRIKTWNR